MGLSVAPQYTQRTYAWSDWKLAQTERGFRTQYYDDGLTYTIYGYDGPEVHVCTIYKGSVPDGVLPGYSQAQNDEDKADFETNFKSSANLKLDVKTSDGRQRVAQEKSDASKVTFYSHDWSDPTTWTTGAVRVVDEIALDSGDHLTYGLEHKNVIDIYHGKVTQEDFLRDANGNSYRVIVKVNGSVMEEQDPHYGSGGDYLIDYSDGTITFLSELDSEDEVKVTYHHENGSTFIVAPTSGNRLFIDSVECQFSEDVELTDTVKFQLYGYVDVFAPHLMDPPYSIPSGTKIPIGDPVCYKTMSDYQNDARRAYPAYPTIGGTSWRGSPYKIVVLVWDYISLTPLVSSAGMEIRISLEHDTPFNGFYATATFYCLTEAIV